MSSQGADLNEPLPPPRLRRNKMVLVRQRKGLLLYPRQMYATRCLQMLQLDQRYSAMLY